MRASSACRRASLKDDSDLGDRLVTRDVPPLPDALVATALGRGAAEARAQIAAGRIVAAVLSLQGRWSVVGESVARPAPAHRPRIEACDVAMLIPATAELPEVERAQARLHRRGRLARQRPAPAPGRCAAAASPRCVKNPYAGRYVADIQPMMEALKPLGREMAARLVDALGGAECDRGATARAR